MKKDIEWGVLPINRGYQVVNLKIGYMVEVSKTEPEDVSTVSTLPNGMFITAIKCADGVELQDECVDADVISYIIERYENDKKRKQGKNWKDLIEVRREKSSNVADMAQLIVIFYPEGSAVRRANRTHGRARMNRRRLSGNSINTPEESGFYYNAQFLFPEGMLDDVTTYFDWKKRRYIFPERKLEDLRKYVKLHCETYGFDPMTIRAKDAREIIQKRERGIRDE